MRYLKVGVSVLLCDTIDNLVPSEEGLGIALMPVTQLFGRCGAGYICPCVIFAVLGSGVGEARSR